MAVVTATQIGAYAYSVGLRGDQLVTSIAVGCAESHKKGAPDHTGDDGAVGDVSLETAKWGPSIGIWQVRTLKAETGKGTSRDINWLKASPMNQAKAMKEISGGGSNFGPWSTYDASAKYPKNNGAYRAHLAAARTAAQQAPTASAGISSPSGGDVSSDPTQSIGPYYGEPATYSLPFTGPTLLPQVLPPRDPNMISILGRTLVDTVGTGVNGGGVDLTGNEVPQITVKYIDPLAQIPYLPQIFLGAVATWPTIYTTFLPSFYYEPDWQLEITGIDIGNEGGVLYTTITFQPQGVSDLQLLTADTIEGVTSSQWISTTLGKTNSLEQQLANNPGLQRSDFPNGLGLFTSGASKLARDSIGPNSNDLDAYGQPKEKQWDVIRRLADEEGCWVWPMFNSRLLYGRPSHFVREDINIDVWQNALTMPELNCTEYPKVHLAEDATFRNATTVSFKLPRWRGEIVKPGMCVFLRDTPFALRRIVTKVHWDFDGGVGDVEVETASVVDPVPSYNGANSKSTYLTDATTSGGNANATNTKKALDFLALCKAQAGKKYIYGAEASTTNADPTAFDCSELVQWAAARVGVIIADGSSNQLAACQKAKTTISIDQARKTPGALLFHPGHVAVSCGTGNTTIEAKGKDYGVTQSTIDKRFTSAAKIPGMVY